MESSQRVKSQVQLGFSVEFEDEQHRSLVGHTGPAWWDWDGGQLGGRPSWLQPRDLPKECLKCKNCEEPLRFLCQLYAPADDVTSDAFHRSLYVFGCPSSACLQATTGSIRVLRAQLPEKNPFYPEEEDETWAMHLPEAWEVDLCKVCGQRGKGKCPIQSHSFCGKHHQKEHKKHIFDNHQKGSSFLPSVCTESELVVEEESSSDPSKEENPDNRADDALFKCEEEDDEEDEKLEQKDMNEMVGKKDESVSKDPTTMTFYERLQSVPNVKKQVLRYMRWPEEEVAQETNTPLWIRTDFVPNSIPPCSCGADRKFEFQLMPQMIHYLLKDHHVQQAKLGQNTKDDDVKEAIRKASSIIEQAPPEQVPPDFAHAKENAIEKIRSKIMGGSDKGNGMSWGVIAVYTCTASCGGSNQDDTELGAYHEEFAWKQPSLD